MGLKKYTDYIHENKNMKTSSSNEDSSVLKESQTPKTTTKKKIIKQNKQDLKKTNEQISFNGKILLFNVKMKPSEILSFLEKKNISKDKLYYIVSEYNDSLVLFKYNLNAEIKLDSFVESLISYHKKKTQSKIDISTKGDASYVIIKNLDEKLKLLFRNNLIKLLK